MPVGSPFGRRKGETCCLYKSNSTATECTKNYPSHGATPTTSKPRATNFDDQICVSSPGLRRRPNSGPSHRQVPLVRWKHHMPGVNISRWTNDPKQFSTSICSRSHCINRFFRSTFLDLFWSHEIWRLAKNVQETCKCNWWFASGVSWHQVPRRKCNQSIWALMPDAVLFKNGGGRTLFVKMIVLSAFNKRLTCLIRSWKDSTRTVIFLLFVPESNFKSCQLEIQYNPNTCDWMI